MKNNTVNTDDIQEKTKPKKRTSPMIWTEEQDDELCKQILLIEPFQFKPRTTQSGSAWSKVAEELNKIASLQIKVDQRAVRDRFKTIKKKFQDKMRDGENASGIAPPDLTPIEEALEDIIAREQDMAIIQSQVDDEKGKMIEKDKKTAEEMRLQSLETFSETKKKKAENNEDDENSKTRKTRRSGSETLSYLKEKAEMDMEFKIEELELKKKEQEKQFEEQIAMRQQQSELLKSLTNMQQSMQCQMQQQAELQQQQMQQNNQMMMMMQMMQSTKKIRPRL